MNRRDVQEDERFQRELRERINPGWRQQHKLHLQILHISGPVKMSAREIINRAMKLNGETPRKKKSHYG